MRGLVVFCFFNFSGNGLMTRKRGGELTVREAMQGTMLRGKFAVNGYAGAAQSGVRR